MCRNREETEKRTENLRKKLNIRERRYETKTLAMTPCEKYEEKKRIQE